VGAANQTIAHHDPKETAALRDFSPIYDRYESITSAQHDR